MITDKDYSTVLKFAGEHYENFPVVSFLIPKNLRKHIAVIYWFARTADDIADEGDLPPEERLKRLGSFESSFLKSMRGESVDQFFPLLSRTIEEMKLSSKHFTDLLIAFKQDVVKKRYADFNELLQYCSYSANPVGRLILELFNIRDEKIFYFSDKICTALQLTNFWQDLLIDYEKGRIYLPQDEMRYFNAEEMLFEIKKNNINLKPVIKHNVDRTRVLFNEGKELLDYLKGRLKYEIKWTISGGEKILSRIQENDYDIFKSRPHLTKSDFLMLLFKTLLR